MKSIELGLCDSSTLDRRLEDLIRKGDTFEILDFVYQEKSLDKDDTTYGAFDKDNVVEEKKEDKEVEIWQAKSKKIDHMERRTKEYNTRIKDITGKFKKRTRYMIGNEWENPGYREINLGEQHRRQDQDVLLKFMIKRDWETDYLSPKKREEKTIKEALLYDICFAMNIRCPVTVPVTIALYPKEKDSVRFLSTRIF